jgi:anti-sigma-K factor RskA
MNAAKQNEPSEIELLLPWYAAGTLDAHESQQVERALANDPELAARYAWVRAELEQETHVSGAAGEPSARDVKTLFAKIDALPARRPRRQPQSSSFGERVAEFLASLSPRTLAWSAAAAALAITLQAGLLADLMIKERTAGGYDTASAPANAQSDGAYVLIRFKPQTTATDIANFLDSNKFSIVAGPSVGQLFRVRVAPNKLAKDDLMRVVTTLQGDKVVDFIALTD